MSSDFRQEPVGNTGPSLLAQQGGGNVLLFNTSATATVWISDDKFGLVPGDPDTGAPLPPLATAVVDGSTEVWGQCPAGQSAQVTKIPGGLSFFQLVEILVKTLLVSATAGNGLFVYSGAPGVGDLIASIVAAQGPDPFGNNADAGISVYNNSTGGVVQLTGGEIRLSAGLKLFFDVTPNQLLMYNASGAALGNLIASLAYQAGTDPFTNPFPAGLAVAAAARSGGVLIGATSYTSSADLEVHSLVGLAQQTAPGTPPAGIVYLYCDSSGNLHAKDHNGVDSQLSPVQTPQSMSALGFLNSWANTGGNNVPGFYRLIGGDVVQLGGSFTVPVAAPNTAIVTLPAAYRPAHTCRVPAMVAGQSGFAAQALSIFVAVDSSGNVTAKNIAAAGTSMTLEIAGTYSLTA